MKRVFAIAFRNVTNSISIAILLIHRGHHWEAVALDPQEVHQHEEDDLSLKPLFLRRVRSYFLDSPETENERNVIDKLLYFDINPITLCQFK